MKNSNRRSFLKTGLIGAAGMVAYSSRTVSGASFVPESDIIFRTLGKTGMKIPVISFGVMRSDNPGLCKAAYENGIKLFDTANVYLNGNSETMLGNLFKDYPRDTFFLATKVKPAGADNEGRPTGETTSEAFIKTFYDSLSKLKTDYVDILYVHNITNPEMIQHKPVINAVRKLKKDGKIRFMGFSTHANETELINVAAESDTWDVILTAYNFKQTYIAELQNAIKKATSAGIGIIAMKTMAGGGFLDKEKSKPINSTAALKWVLSNPDITTTIPGMTDFDQVDLNVKLLSDISLTDAEKRDLIIAKTETGLFCTACRKCIPSCQRHLPVPDLMRAYMYAYGYSNRAMAYSLLGELGTGDNPCSSCSTCKIECTKNFNLKEKISDISRLVNVPADFIG
jgi:uncharacterized protein